MSADVLRRAAALMRERAGAATPGPWAASADVAWAITTERPCYCDEPFCECDPVAAEVVDRADAQHIASWHPAVALAVADWLELTASDWERHTLKQRVYALDVARAYLGSDA